MIRRVRKCIVFLCLVLPGCGYRLANKSPNGGQGQTIAVPAFINKTTTYRIEQLLAEAVRQELTRRTRYKVVADDTGDVVVSGEVLAYVAVPVIFNPAGRATAYSLNVDLKVKIADTTTGKVLFQNDRFTFRDVFELSQNSGQFVPEDSAALDRLSRRFASSLVGTVISAVAIAFRQEAAATPQSAATVSVAYPRAQTAGNLNIVVVGCNDTTAAVQSVKDSAGNNYNLAIGPTIGTALQQSIYYASPIVGGSNTVSVTFSQAAAHPDVRILEYNGVTTLDSKAGASGNSATANSGAATTTVASELIFGADTVATSTKAAGSGFTSRIITPHGDIAEDKVVTTAGSNSASARLNSSGPWVMQMVTFK